VPAGRRRKIPAQVLLGGLDFKFVNRTLTSPLSLLPGTLLLAVILVAQKIVALLGW
jgi:hypothetical protein